MDESTLSICVSNSINFVTDECLNLGTYVLVSARKSGHSLCPHVAGNNRPRCPATDLRLLCHAIIILAIFMGSD